MECQVGANFCFSAAAAVATPPVIAGLGLVGGALRSADCKLGFAAPPTVLAGLGLVGGALCSTGCKPDFAAMRAPARVLTATPFCPAEVVEGMLSL